MGETRLLLQGARLTVWEMVQEIIPVTLATDNMTGYLMSRGEIVAVVVGTDRVAEMEMWRTRSVPTWQLY